MTNAETPRQLQLTDRSKKLLGLHSVAGAQEKATRIPFEPYDPASGMGVMDYAHTNAKLGGLTNDIRRFKEIFKGVEIMDKLYSLTLRGISQHETAKPGFTREQSVTVFSKNLTSDSRAVVNSFLSVLDAAPANDPISTEFDGGLCVWQEYASSTGINFVDVRTVVAAGKHQDGFQTLFAYLPAPKA